MNKQDTETQRTQAGSSTLVDNLLIEPGKILIKGALFDLHSHAHHAIQLCVPLQGPVRMMIAGEPVVSEQAVVIGSDVDHQLQAGECLILLIEPESHWGHWFNSRYLTTSETKAQWVQLKIDSQALASTEMSRWVGIVFEQIGVPDCGKRHLDPRIIKTLETLDAMPLNAMAMTISANEMAQRVALSESRFLHLFRQETQIAWRPYLLWRRLLMAVSQVLAGHNLTMAAHQAGFSDSAHFTRSFKKMFGINAKQVLSRLITDVQGKGSTT